MVARRTFIQSLFSAPLIGKAKPVQPPVPVLSVVTYPPGATKTQQRIVIDGVRGAIFEYANGGPAGALVSSWASKAGTDPYGNTYPEGFNAGAGSGFTGTDFYIDNTGMFFYAPSNGVNNLVVSVTPSYAAANTDKYGNWFIPGVATYGPDTTDGSGYLANVFTGLQQQWYFATTMTGATTPWSSRASFSFSNLLGVLLSNNGPIIVNSNGGDLTLENTGSTINALANGDIQLKRTSGLSYLFNDHTNNVLVGGYPIYAATAAGGTIRSVFGNLTLLNGWTVGSGGIARAKVMPDNTVQVQLTNLSGGTLTNGTVLYNIPTGPPNQVPTQTATQNFGVDVVSSSSAQINTPFLAVRSTGTVTLQDFPNNITNFSACFRYALD